MGRSLTEDIFSDEILYIHFLLDGHRTCRLGQLEKNCPKCTLCYIFKKTMNMDLPKNNHIKATLVLVLLDFASEYHPKTPHLL